MFELSSHLGQWYDFKMNATNVHMLLSAVQISVRLIQFLCEFTTNLQITSSQLAFVAKWTRFSKVPKRYRLFSDVTISTVSQEPSGFKSSNFTIILLFVALKTCLKDRLSKSSGFGSFVNGFPKRFRDFRETGPTTPISQRS